MYETVDSLLRKAVEMLDKPFHKIDYNCRLEVKNNKGGIGHVLEDNFGYELNSSQTPDFEELGIELKVTPYIVSDKKKIRAKERMVITMIDYNKDYDVDFFNSHCYSKIYKILMMLYEYKKEIETKDLSISKIFLYEFAKLPLNDQKIIKNDYLTIINKIKEGKAHELSESDTLYLSACTKGKNSSDLTTQPFSNLLAKKRAFSLKNSYMTSLLNSEKFKMESIVKNGDNLEDNSFENVVRNMLKKYNGKTLDEVDEVLGFQVNRKAKNYLRTYFNNMLNLKSDVTTADEIVKANIKIKTIKVQNNKIKESMSFPTFKFMDLINEEWEDSTLRTTFEETKYLFVVFNQEGADIFFKDIKLWSMPTKDIEGDLYDGWKSVQDTLKAGVKLTPVKSGNSYAVKNNFHNLQDNRITHVRPHASLSINILKDGTVYGKGNVETDGDVLPSGEIMTKQCFFLNNSYIYSIIKDIL